MTSKSGFKIERWDTTLLSVFYLISGIVYFLILAVDFGNLVTVFLGFLSLIIAYGLIKLKKWTVPFVLALFFPQITFGIFALYASVTVLEDLFFNLVLIVHMMLLTFCFLYVAAKREEFQS
jgi:hypothetical protein